MPRIQSDIENEELNKKLEHLKSIPLPENCLVMDHYTSMESRLELRAKIKEIYAEIQELLPSLSLLQVSEALFNNFLNTGGKALDIIGAEMTNIHDGVTAFTNLTDEVTEALSSERNRTLAFTTLFELQWETLLEWKRDARVLKVFTTSLLYGKPF